MISKPESYIKHVYSEYRRNAMVRNIEFKITIEFFWSLIQMSCTYCGKDPEFRNRGIIPINGVDRADPSMGYTEDNCVTACKSCNKLKSAMPVKEFLDAIKRIYEKNK